MTIRYETHGIARGSENSQCNIIMSDGGVWAVCGVDHTGQPSSQARKHAAMLRKTVHPDFKRPLNCHPKNDWPVNEPWS